MRTLDQKYKAWMLIILGSIVWSLAMVKSGLIYSFGMGFWGPNGHDGVWHISLIRSLASGSWQMPIFAGEAIKNYHIGFDLLVALIHKVTSIPVVNLYFQIIPPLLALGIGFGVNKLVKEWKKSDLAAFWALLFTFFATSWGWVVTLIRYKNLGGESMFWSQQAASTLINPPLALSLLILVWGLVLLFRKKWFLTAILWGLLPQVKIYASVLILSGLALASLYEIISERKFTYLKTFLLTLVISMVVFFAFNKSVSGLIVFKPFWFVETMMSSGDRVNWPKYYQAMINYHLDGNFIKGVTAYLVGAVIFIFGNIGIRVIGLFSLLKKNQTKEDVLFWVIIGMGFFIPMIFVQTGTPWNTIQFTYYSLFFLSIISGVTIAAFKKNKTFLPIFLLLTLPGIWGTLLNYLPSRPPAKISNQELEALHTLENMKPGIVLIATYDQEAASAAVNNPPRPLYLYESTAYVSAFSGHHVFMEDEVNLNITGYLWESRRDATTNFFNEEKADAAQQFFKSHNIKYLYLTNKRSPKAKLEETGAKKVFSNEEVTIWETSNE